MLLWESSPRLLLLSIFCATASRALKVLSLLGTLKLAYLVFHPPSELLAAIQPMVLSTGAAPSTLIAATSATLIAGIFAAAAMMTIKEAHYRDETMKKFEIFLATSFFEFNDRPRPDDKAQIETSKLTELIKLSNNCINALSLSALLAATSIVLFVMSPSVATAMIFCAALVFGVVLYIGSRTRRKSSQFADAKKRLELALCSEPSQLQETDAEHSNWKSAPAQSHMLTRLLAVHDARSRVSKFTARLNAITLLSTGALIGLAILLVTDADIVSVILILLLVRFFLSYAQTLANQLQGISNGLDILDWARVTFSKCVPAK